MYQAKDYSHLIGTPGFSERLLTNHFTLYQGYVTNTNTLLEKLTALREQGQIAQEYNELQRRFGWEFDGMRLHEYYFDNLSKEKKLLDPDHELTKQIVRDFGSVDLWKKDFQNIGKMRGIGWAALYYDPQAGRLFNVWIGEHNENHLPGCTLLVIMDMWEHAFMVDYNLNKAEYIEAFFQAIHWEVVTERFGA